MAFKDFKAKCVEPFSDAAKTLTDDHKLYGGMSHGDESYHFDVQGVDPQFAATTLAPDAIVGDADKPGDGDRAYELLIDQEVLGPVSNDYANNDPTKAKQPWSCR